MMRMPMRRPTVRRWAARGRSAVAIVGFSMLLSTPGSQVGVAVAQTDGDVPVEAQRYLKALERVCDDRVTPELVRLHQEAVKALDAAKYGGGRNSNFWGVRTPEHAWQDCFQAGGDLK